MTSISHTSTAIRDCDQFVLLGDSVAATEKFFTTRVPRIGKGQKYGKRFVGKRHAESCLVVRSADYKVTFCAKQCSRQWRTDESRSVLGVG